MEGARSNRQVEAFIVEMILGSSAGSVAGGCGGQQGMSRRHFDEFVGSGKKEPFVYWSCSERHLSSKWRWRCSLDTLGFHLMEFRGVPGLGLTRVLLTTCCGDVFLSRVCEFGNVTWSVCAASFYWSSRCC